MVSSWELLVNFKKRIARLLGKFFVNHESKP